MLHLIYGSKAKLLCIAIITYCLLMLYSNSIYAQPLGEKIQSVEPKIKEPEYFILYINTSVSINAIASGTIQTYKGIRTLNDTVPIYMVFYNYSVSDIATYANRNFFVDTINDIHLQFIENEALNQLIHSDEGLTMVYFFKEKNIIYSKDAKFHSPKEYNLPIYTHWNKKEFPILKFKPSKYTIRPEIESVQSLENIQLISTKELISQYQFSSVDQIFPISNDELVILIDANNECVQFDINSGKEIKTFEKVDSPINLLKQWNEDLTEEEIAAGYKFEKEFLEKVNRKSHFIFNYNKQKNFAHHTLSSGFQIGLPMRKEFTIKNAYGKNKHHTIKKGEVFGIGIGCLEVFNEDITIAKRYKSPDIFSDLSNPITEEDKVILPTTESGMYWLDDSTFYTLQEYGYEETNLDTFKHFIGKYRLQDKDNSIAFVSSMPPQMSKGLKKKYKYWGGFDFSYFFEMNGNINFVTYIDNAIFQIDKPEPIGYIGKAEYSKQKNNRNYILNYQTMSIDCYNGYLFTIYVLKNKQCILEIKNTQLETIKTIDISNLRGVAENKADGYWGVSVFNGKLYAKYLQNKKTLLSVYDVMME